MGGYKLRIHVLQMRKEAIYLKNGQGAGGGAGIPGEYGGIKGKILNFLGYRELGGAFVLVLLVHVGQMLFTNPKGIFINTLLFRATDGNVSIVKLYNILTYVSECLGTTLAIWVIRRKGAVYSIRAGLVVFLATYVSFFIFFSNLNDFMFLIGFLFGIGTGLYWSSYYLYITEYSTDSTRDIALGAVGVCTSIISFVVPSFCGFVISKFSGLNGYLAVFAGALVIALFIVLLSTKLKNQMTGSRKSYYRQAVKTVFTEKVWFCGVFTEFLRGLRDGAFAFFLNLLLFQIIQDESLVGFNTAMVGVVAILSNWVMKKILRPHNRVKIMTVSVSVLLCCSIAMFFQLSPVTIIIMSLVNSFFSVYIYNPTLGIFLTLLDKTKKGERMRVELLAVKNYFLSFGRVIGVLLTILLPNTDFGNVTALCVLTALQYFTAFFAGKTTTLIAQEEQKDSQEALEPACTAEN